MSWLFPGNEKQPVKESLPDVDSMSLAEAKAWILRHLDDGTSCLACGQYCKRYKRLLSYRMANWLMALAGLSPGGEWVHCKAVFGKLAGTRNRGSNADDYNYLAYWNLIERPPAAVRARLPTPPRVGSRKPGRSGYWRPTPAGHAFARNKLLVYKYAITALGKLERFAGDPINIREALGKDWDWGELMTTYGL